MEYSIFSLQALVLASLALTAITLMVLINRDRTKVEVQAKTTVIETFRETVHPYDVEQTSVDSGKFYSSSFDFSDELGTSIQTSDFSMEGDEARMLFEMVNQGDRIAAVKFIREKKDDVQIDSPSSSVDEALS